MTEQRALLEQQLLEQLACIPSDPTLRFDLGRVQFELLKYADALTNLRHAIVLDPDDPLRWVIYARCLAVSYEGLEAVDAAFERAAKLGHSNPGVLVNIINFFFGTRNYGKALGYIDKLFRISEGEKLNPVIQIKLLRCLAGLGRHEQAEQICHNLIPIYYAAATERSGSDREFAMLMPALLLHAAQRHDDVSESLRHCATALAPVIPAFGDPQHGIDNFERVQRMRRMMHDRDVFILLPGPSLSNFVERLDEFRDWDFVSAVISIHYEPLKSRVLDPLGRKVDLLWASNPAHIRAIEADIHDILEPDSEAMLVTQSYALSELRHLDQFIDRYLDKMLFINCGEIPGTPSFPLRFLNGNSLTPLVPLINWGQPRRIFLFGADAGGIPHEINQKVYFYTPSSEEQEGSSRTSLADRLVLRDFGQRVQEESRRLFLFEGLDAEETIDISLLIQEHVFGLRRPQIYNCCPYSGMTRFPRISIEQALAMKGGALLPPMT